MRTIREILLAIGGWWCILAFDTCAFGDFRKHYNLVAILASPLVCIPLPEAQVSADGLAFALWTIANLAPRAWTNHQWYRRRFPDYPQKRRVLLPGLW